MKKEKEQPTVSSDQPKGLEVINNIVPDKLKKFFAWLGKRGLSFGAFIACLASGFLFASLDAVLRAQSNETSDFTSIKFVGEVSVGRFLLLMMLISCALIAVTLYIKRALIAHYALLFGSIAFAYTLVTIVSGSSWSSSSRVDLTFILGVALVLIIIMKYLCAGDKLQIDAIGKTKVFSSWKISYAIVAVAVVCFTVMVSVYTYYRFKTYATSTYDFGIFAQMFEGMARGGLPMTTTERGEALSHFAVHFSPSWYLLLPGYLIFRHPVYLFIANAFVIALGAFPVFRICKKLGSTPLFATALSLIYLLFPTMAGSAFYDIHENSLLPVLILYMVYFFISEKTLPMFGFALLTLGDKEDAAIYVGAFALYVIFATKKKWTGAALLALSAVYFVFACGMIGVFGGEVMTSRLSAYYTEDHKDFFGVIKTCFTDIGYLIKRVFYVDAATPSSAKSEAAMFGGGKLQFMLWMLLPVMFAPFLSKKNSLLFLLVPMLVENLMPTWVYQYDVYYQYTYGPAALIVFAAIMAFSAMEGEKKIFFVGTALILSFVMSGALFWTKADMYKSRYENGKMTYIANDVTIERFLDEYYEEGDTVSANTFLTPHLYMIEDLYTVPKTYYDELYETDWYLTDKRYTSADYFPSFLKRDYELVNPDDNSNIKIYRKIEQN